ncbi:MAG: GntR family transcriptional regulator [Rubritepida sp.]|nr:GntR family transcriptional regulator [Rubritepida sp.]MCU0945875.1 GntR family transcriptional regulator [Rubritepida sp.]
MPIDSVASPALSSAAATARVVEAVLEAIAQARLPAGTRLPEEPLAALFGVSRAVVREALKSLAERGILVLLPHRGAAVATPTAEEAEQCYAARALIEGAMAAELAQNITAADIRRLRAHIARQQETLAAGARREHLRLMGEFHQLLAALHGNAVLAELLDRLITRTSLMTALFPPASQACAVEDHVALVDALARGDAEAARAVASAHLRGNHTRLRPDAARRPVDLRAALLG